MTDIEKIKQQIAADFGGTPGPNGTNYVAVSWGKVKQPQASSYGGSGFDGHNWHAFRIGDENKPDYFEWNGEEVTEEQYRVLRAPYFP